MLRTIREFWNDQRGIAMILVSIMLPVLIGFALLAVDMSRATGLHNDLQKGVDALALAAAAELDGNPDAITRANRAVTNLISNRTRFSTLGDHQIALADVTVTYLTGIPASDSIALTAAGLDSNGVNWASTDPKLVKFAEVTVNASGATTDGAGAFETLFPVSLSNISRMDIRPQAVAGFTNALCQFTPMFICNPYTSLGALQTAVSGTSKPMILLKEQTGGNNAQYLPGNYGFLSSPEGDKSTATLTEMFAVTNPPACYGQNGVTTRPGNIPPVDAGINTRFDLYDNSGPYKTDPTVNPPAPNVRKGMAVSNAGKKSCAYAAPDINQASKYMALPHDTGCCAQAGVPGSGLWNFTGYWSVNHGTASTSGVLTACGANPSRYCVYKYEINNPTLKSGQEKTAPQCNTTTQGADRRLLYVAIVDCVNNIVKGGNQTLPVQAFASMFVTEPAGGPPDANIYAEFEDISTSVGQGTLKKLQRNEAQLYR
ncbi:pilus assembly protein TadG-related protein [Mesorhizobium sp. ESP-6-4]|uniref:TadE/TadG family type IV pilus assembly protein n=1 Tax=Mesorhizobium sp. ESP-6-4 TaxID=2876624 RepID=UPI001CCA08DA|nr:pilus assembly protein TadG-related protein [Mesorhizobium sp. ESP-6-4]MBZ9662849.1 pilus assembly protein TadG-related protein [Mesorhizobium sp. ESP-6-4]